MPIDLRSDTITRPTAAMREVIARAEVGDDVFLDDPTVNRLEARTAEVLGQEAALYVPSGTMANQLCLKVHARSGIFEYETGAPAAVSGLLPRYIDSADGTFTADDVAAELRPLNIHHARNRIVAVENTHNRCGGVVWPLEQYQAVSTLAHEHGLVVHLDGARLWNVCAATDTEPPAWTGHADSVGVCFSKGLGAPIGSALAGSREFVEEARFYRKMFGGQMRQAGIIAAAALYALDNHRARLPEDHANARLLAEKIDATGSLRCVPPATNIVIIDVLDKAVSAPQIVEGLAAEGVVLLAMGERKMRAVTHLDVSRDDCANAGDAFQRVMYKLCG
jgi:threonine aldolase